MRKHLEKFLPGRWYHIFNRSNNRERLFAQPRNYPYFLNRYHYYMNGVLETHAYCLLYNHFHLLVRARSEEALMRYKKKQEAFDCHKVIARQFQNFFSTYSKAFNKQQDRYGSLFQRPFKRKEIKDEAYLANIVYYIHANPTLHKKEIDFMTYDRSSYQAYLRGSSGIVETQTILEWMGGLDQFIDFHSRNHDLSGSDWLLE